ncbi:MAG TPA: hypothetical protein VD738_01780 [Nitrospira sp.]|nr:hypothetical protein [Nitrospira sp.]
MISAALLHMNKPFLVTVALTTGLWSISQKGCVPDSDLRPDTATPVVASPHLSDHSLPAQSESIRSALGYVGYSELSETPGQSLKKAAALLRKAADVLDKNELVAVQLIRQVIAILKHHVIPSLNRPDAVLVPIASPAAGLDQGSLSEAMVAQGLPPSLCTHQSPEEHSDSPI